MQATTITKFRWFWLWQDDIEEAWLESMSGDGWHLVSVALPGFYTFAAGEPRAYAYRLDYRRTTRRERPSYLRLFEDTGWEHLGEMNNWQYFRKLPRSGESAEIFTDPESKVAKYHRVLGIMVVLLPILMSTANAIRHRVPSPWVTAGQLFYVALLLLWVFCIAKIVARTKQLKRP